MKVISNTVKFETYVESDPGVYPNAVAGYALPDTPVCEWSGEIVLEAESDSETEEFEEISDWFNDWANDPSSQIYMPYGWSVDWKFVWEGNTVTATPVGADPKEEDYGD